MLTSIFQIFFTTLYVAPFYISPRTRPSPTLNRDSPTVIRARIRTVSVTVTISTLTTLYIHLHYGHQLIPTALHTLGLYPISPIVLLCTLSLTFLLYMAPLYETFVVDASLTPLSTLQSRISTTLRSSIGYRNYIAGPITEELLFRSTIIPLHLLSPLRDSPAKIVFLTPLYFGIAHIHHLYEFKLTHPDLSWTPALLRSVFQFGYTSVFGWYATFIYLRTGSLWACVLIHIFANFMGLPRFWGRVRASHSVGRAALQPAIRGKDDTEGDPIGKGVGTSGGESIVPTIIYYTLLLGGAFAFYWCFWSLTDMPESALVKFDKKS